MPVFETRGSEVEEYVINKILKSDSKDDAGAYWDDPSDLCMLKIYGIKTLVKSYLPVKDAHVRSGIDGLLDILKNMLTYGKISSEIHSSLVDKAHLRLASAKAVLRLSRQWDHKIPIGLFYWTLETSKINFPKAKKIFLSKVHQYIKDRLLDAKYSCALMLSIFESKADEFAEGKQYLVDIIEMLQQTKAREQSDVNSAVTYPEYILPYLVHALAHNSCPNIDECKEVETYDNIYRQLHLILSILLHRDEDAKSEATSNEEKEIISTITSIFQSIKHVEDMVDTSKSKNSHALCDLGLAITKRLVQKDVDLEGLSTSVSLPSMLYKACEKKEGDDSLVKAIDEEMGTGFLGIGFQPKCMHEKLVEQGRIEDFGFLCPVYASTTSKELRQEYISKRVCEVPRKVYLFPNWLGNHYRLVVMNMVSHYVIFLCSTHSDPSPTLKQIINNGMTTFQRTVKKRRGFDHNPKWYQPKTRRQLPESNLCVPYVMKHIYNIVTEGKTKFPQRGLPLKSHLMMMKWSTYAMCFVNIWINWS
ncbi:hypothetical protein K1719_009129 [Acacia pycnantha]|nr:hypothetical protein K1719_009129 [Acacia pycnantha]